MPTPITSTPVALGSSVPAWPTRRSPSRRRSMPTTSWLVTPAGLSTTARPWTVAGRRRATGQASSPAGPAPRRMSSIRWAERITSSGRNTRTGVFFVRIWRLIDDWIRRRCSSRTSRIGASPSSPSQRVEVHDGPVELVVDVDVGDRDERQALVVDADELLGDDLAQGLVQPGAAGVAVPSGAATSTHRGDANGAPTRV